MKVALTVWEDRISPLFDAARELLIADISDGRVTNRRHEPMTSQWPLRVAERLVEQEVKALVCGAISEVPAGIIESAGIKLLAFVAGAVDDVLETLAKGRPIIPLFSMPGCGCPKCPRPGGRRKDSRDGISGEEKLPAGRVAHSGQNRKAGLGSIVLMRMADRTKGDA